MKDNKNKGAYIIGASIIIASIIISFTIVQYVGDIAGMLPSVINAISNI